jgi:hypothetical protein
LPYVLLHMLVLLGFPFTRFESVLRAKSSRRRLPGETSFL